MVSDKVGYDNADCIWSFSEKWGKKSTKTLEGSQGVEHQVVPNRVGNLEKEDTRRSMIQRHLIVATDCWRISLVSAPGWSSRLQFLDRMDVKLGCKTYVNVDEAYHFRKELMRLAR